MTSCACDFGTLLAAKVDPLTCLVAKGWFIKLWFHQNVKLLYSICPVYSLNTVLFLIKTSALSYFESKSIFDKTKWPLDLPKPKKNNSTRSFSTKLINPLGFNGSREQNWEPHLGFQQEKAGTAWKRRRLRGWCWPLHHCIILDQQGYDTNPNEALL